MASIARMCSSMRCSTLPGGWMPVPAKCNMVVTQPPTEWRHLRWAMSAASACSLVGGCATPPSCGTPGGSTSHSRSPTSAVALAAAAALAAGVTPKPWYAAGWPPGAKLAQSKPPCPVTNPPSWQCSPAGACIVAVPVPTPTAPGATASKPVLPTSPPGGAAATAASVVSASLNEAATAPAGATDPRPAGELAGCGATGSVSAAATAPTVASAPGMGKRLGGRAPGEAAPSANASCTRGGLEGDRSLWRLAPGQKRCLGDASGPPVDSCSCLTLMRAATPADTASPGVLAEGSSDSQCSVEWSLEWSLVGFLALRLRAWFAGGGGASPGESRLAAPIEAAPGRTRMGSDTRRSLRADPAEQDESPLLDVRVRRRLSRPDR